ncbi:MAG: GNAT family N-acetyltransferase [Clostridia bacterium]|nr:GNAT family N-acetyltransferase [Clostridia bacterium]
MYIREASADDSALISSIIAASWRGHYQHLIDPVYLSRLPDTYWLPSIRSWLSDGRMYGCIAEADGKAVGSVIYGRGRDEPYADWGEIVSLYLLPEYVGQGIGHTLLNSALAGLREDGYNRFYLWAIDGAQTAQRFYARHGFIPATDRITYRIGAQNVTDIRYILEE